MNRIIEVIKSEALKNPAKIALSDARNCHISYQELCVEIERLAKFLREKSLTSIAIFADNSPSWIAFDLACFYAQVTLTPIPHFFTKEQIINLLDESAIEAVLSDSLMKLPVDNLGQDDLKIFDFEFSLLKISEQNSDKKFPEKTLKITFTSGSTGTPKGVCLGSKQIENVVFSLAEKLQDQELNGNLSLLPLAVLLENIAGIYCSLIIGSKAIIPSLLNVGIGGSSSLDVEKLCKILNQTKPHSLILVPELAKVLIALISAKKLTNFDFKFIAVGGAKISPDLLKQAEQLNLPLYQGYGVSEFSSVVALNKKGENKIGTVGKILPHIEVKISTENEILLKGNLALGYSNGKDLDLDENGWYKSGDIGHIEDDFLFIDGRKKNIFISSFGRNINPEWIESELLKSPLILQIIVFGEAMPYNLAIIVAPPKTDFDKIKAEVDAINLNLPDYGQVRKIILASAPFTVKNNMLTGNGRVRRNEILKYYQNQIT